MVRPSENWERRVRATLRREKLWHDGRGGQERAPSGIAGSVPLSLIRETNIDLILQAAEEIQSEDPNVARIRCARAVPLMMLVTCLWRITAVRLCASLQMLVKRFRTEGQGKWGFSISRQGFEGGICERQLHISLLETGAVYERKYLLGTLMARPVIAKGHG